LLLGRGASTTAHAYEEPEDKYEAWGGRFQLAGNDDRAGTDPHHVGDFGREPGAGDAIATCDHAYNTTLSTLRQARDNAVSQRTAYSVTFSNAAIPNTITVAPTLTGSSAFQGDQKTAIYSLPTDVTFQTNSAISASTAPDSSPGSNFGTGANPIDFGYTGSGGSGGATTIYFCPTVLHRPCPVVPERTTGTMAWCTWRKGQIC